MRKLTMALVALAVTVSATAVPADAQRHRDGYAWRDGADRDWDPARAYHAGKYRERRLGRHDRIYRGRDGRAYCRRTDGSTGLVVGALSGAVLAKLAGGSTLAALAVGGGGALLGREIDRGKIKCR